MFEKKKGGNYGKRMVISGDSSASGEETNHPSI
jgi:hypothetical protein